MADAGRVDPDFRQIIRQFHLEGDPLVLGRDSERFQGFQDHRMGGDRLKIHLDPSGFDAADIEQVVEDVMEPVAVFPGCDQQLHLFFREGSDLLFQEQVDGHANGGQGRLQLMGNGRDDPSFQFILMPLFRHVLQGDDHAVQLFFAVQDGTAIGRKYRSSPFQNAEWPSVFLQTPPGGRFGGPR